MTYNRLALIQDPEFYDSTLDHVTEDEHGWTISHGGWCFHVSRGEQEADNVMPVARPGMPLRFYGGGIGTPVRGLMVDGAVVFYKTAAEYREQSEIRRYGADSMDWLARWDAGRSVWSLAMGGLGPGYEQAIQITAAEMLRHIWGDAAAVMRDAQPETAARARADALVDPRLDPLGLSGAQWGAAAALAARLFTWGPRKMFTDPKMKDRMISVSKDFPRLA